VLRLLPKRVVDTAETIMYPNIVTKGPGRTTLQELMDSDLATFRKRESGMTYVDGDILSRIELLRFAISTVSTRAHQRP